MDKKVGMESFFIAIGTICALTLTLGVVCAADIFVGPSETYTSIQLAVTAANASDTIIVRDNTYTENININKSLMIYSENGSENCIVTALNPNDHVFNVTADWVNITGFTVQNATGDDMAGIFLDDVMNCTISNNNATNNFHGIWLYNCGYGQKGNILLNNNTAYANIGWGIYLSLSNGNNITENTCAYNGFAGDYSYDGIGLEDSNDNIISKNNCSSNAWAGIYLGDYSSNNNVTSNTCSDNQQGIQIRDASNNVFTNNTVSNNVYGIYLYPGSNNNTLTDNTATSNYYYNIHLEVSNNNTFTNNTASFTGLMAGAIRADTGTYKVVYFSFGFEGINNATMRDTVMNRTIKWLSPSLTENVLLVDDDEGAAYETYYNGSLTNNGIGYDYWDTSSQGSPTGVNLSAYPVVIWFTGNDYEHTLETNEQSALEWYLNAGGSLFITGQDIGYYLIEDGNDDGVFYANYLHAKYIMDNTDSYGLVGVSGDPISVGLVVGIEGGDGADNQNFPSGILPRENATTVFYYAGPGGGKGISLYYSSYNTLTGNTANENSGYGIYLYSTSYLLGGAIRADTGTYKVVYFSFGFEGINNATMRDTVMNRTIKWLSPSLTENVLLVDDDEGAAYESYYNGSLINNGIGYDYWNTSSQGSPTSANLSSYPVVIWFTGDAGTLTSTEQYELEGYLNAGGNLFLTGQDIGYDLIMNGNDDGVFYSNYLHATFVMDNANKYALAGMAGDPISDGLVIGISDGDGAGNQEWPSGILPGENATTVFYYVPPDASIGNNISCNLVHHNTYCGFFLTGESTGNTIEYNNIIANGIYNGTSYGYEYNFYNNQSDNVEAKYNWWGTAVSSEIAASINADPGTVDYDSFLIAPAECAPSEAPQFCIEIEKQINGVNYVTATPGETLEVTLWINNCGTVNLTNLSVRDNFPLKQSNAGLSYANISDPVGLEISGIFEGWIDDDLVWNNLTQFEPLQPRENFTITFEATVDELAKGLLENCATVNANYTIPGQVSVTVNDTDCATVSVSSPEVSEVPILTPTGLVALASLLSAIAAVALVRKRR
jgi:parallel beta-helix repeat protein